MSKIHALLKDWDKYRGSQWAEDAIVDPWNAAVAAMKDAASYAYSSGYTYCRVCRLARVMGHQDSCFVGKLQAALAKMEGTDGND